MTALKRIGIAFGALLALVAVVVSFSASLYWRDMRIEEPQGIREEGYVRIGGIDQWVQIRGQDRNNPVLLWLNGGPGFSTIGETWFFRDWERHYTIVMWDQRGEGKTFERSGASVKDTMTISQLASDGVALSAYLTRHLRKDKIVLLGHSWGSMLGVHMVHSQPDLFSVYVGTGQLVNQQQNAFASYPLLLARARARGSSLAEQELLAAGPPPYSEDVREWIPLLTWAQAIDPPSTEESPPPTIRLWLSLKWLVGEREVAPGITPAVQFSMNTLWPEIVRDDLPALGLRFDVPVVFVQGTEDITTETALARSYFDRIEAPVKKFVTLEDAGHLALFRDRAGFLRALEEHVRPLALHPEVR